MNFYDNEDKKIESILNADIYEPNSYTQAIKTALKIKRVKKTISFSKIIATILAGFMLIGGIVYAEQIEKLIIRFFNNSRGMDTAIENGYIEEHAFKFNTQSNTKVEISDIVIDNNNLSFMLNFLIDIEEKDEIGNIKRVIIPDIIITDGANNIIFFGNLESVINYCKDNNSYNITDYALTENSMDSHIILYSKEKNLISMAYNVYSVKDLPFTEKLYINFKTINLIYENKEIYLNDCWEVNINLPEYFQNRSINKYHIIDNDNALINLNKFNIYYTGTVFEIESFFKPVYTNNMTIEEINERTNKFIEWSTNLNNKIITDEYIENSYGKRFYLTESSLNDAFIVYNLDGSFKHRCVFSLTKFDLTDELKVHFTVHTIDDEKEITIKLKRDD